MDDWNLVWKVFSDFLSVLPRISSVKGDTLMQNPSESVNFKQDEGFPVQNAQKKVPNKKAAVPAWTAPHLLDSMVYCLGNGVFLYAKGTTKVQRNAEGRNH